MINNTIALLGIPIDNVTIDQSVEQIISMANDFSKDKRPRYVATVNVDFMVNTLSWWPGQIRHPELIEILRKADLITPDGMPIIWTSKLIGSPLKERVTGADLVPRLAAKATEQGKSLFFLGGNNGVGKQAANVLKSQNPGLRIAGISSPFVHTEGKDLIESQDKDHQIIEEINQSGADILLIGFGNPKQEIWFERNRDKIKIPVSIGIGGTYDFITGSVKRAPGWMQKTGLEWIFRIIQDPKRLWKRYFIGFFKFGFMILPAILFFRYKRLVDRIFRSKSPARIGRLDSSQYSVMESIKLINIPDRLDATSISQTNHEIEYALEFYSNIVLDFGKTTFIDSTGLGFLIRSWQQCKKEEIPLYLTGLDTNIIGFFKFNRLWDLFEKISLKDFEELFQKINEKTVSPPFLVVADTGPDSLRLDLHGRLDANQMYNLDMKSLLAEIEKKNCILNLEKLDFIDSTGLVFFLKIQKHLVTNNRFPVLCSLSESVRQMFDITKLINLFHIETDIISAEKRLRKIK